MLSFKFHENPHKRLCQTDAPRTLEWEFPNTATAVPSDVKINKSYTYQIIPAIQNCTFKTIQRERSSDF